MRSHLMLMCTTALAVALAWPWPAHAIDPLPFRNQEEEARFQHLTGELRCLVCQNESLADSNADLAKDLRKQIFDLMRGGESDVEIKRYLSARYSDFVLYDPPFSARTLLLWVGPYFVLGLGLIRVGAYVRRAKGHAVAPDDAGEPW